MNQLQNKSFEEALVRYREKWDKIKDPGVTFFEHQTQTKKKYG